MKKVLFLIYKLVGGGAEKVLVDIVNHIDHTLYDVTVMTIADCSSDAHLLNSNIKYDYIFKGRWKEDRAFFKLFKRASPQFLHQFLIKDQYDIEISALEGIPAKIISGCQNTSTKKIAFIHADASNIAWPSNRYKDFYQEYDSYNHFDHLIFVSNNTRKKFIEKFNIELIKTVVIYNPFDFQKIEKMSLEQIDDYKKTSNFLFCAIGRLESVKGFDRLIDAFHEMHKQFPYASLLIIGEGKERDFLSKKINEHKLNNHITLLGYRTNPYKYLKFSDCYICSSRSEGLSSTVIEAMILNVPIIATDCGGMDEILKEYQKGIIVNNETEGLIRGMGQFLNEIRGSNKINKEVNQNNLQKFSFNHYYESIVEMM